MIDYAKVNKKWWNTVTPIHARSKLYDLENFKKGKTSLQQLEIEEVGDVQGKSLLHLLCHFGMDTLSWARRGAVTTGVDISDSAITFAQQLSKEITTPADFICSDVYNLPEILNQQFDIVFMSYGVLLWLPDVTTWARLIYQYLKTGGMFYIVETHPFTNMLSAKMHLAFDYFDTTPFVDDASGTYADWNANITGKTYIWLHSLGEILTALTTAGLSIQYVHEFPYTMYNQFPGYMRKDGEGKYRLRRKDLQIPLLFSLKAIKSS